MKKLIFLNNYELSSDTKSSNNNTVTNKYNSYGSNDEAENSL